MDIDTGDSPLVSSRPYTLVLKHHRWVQEEIETLERAGVITKSMSPWASPIVVIPKKSQPEEPPKKRLCIDFRKINDLQQKVITEGKSKGCLSLISLPKIDEMYTKLKGAKFFFAKSFFLKLCRMLFTGFLVPALFGSCLHLLSEGCTLVWGMVVRGCAHRDLC